MMDDLLIRGMAVISLLINLTLMNFCEASEKSLVPSKKVAAEIAEAVLVPIYGHDVLKQRPFEVTESSDYWLVDGVLRAPPTEVAVGGTVHIEIRKKDGLLKNVRHSK